MRRADAPVNVLVYHPDEADRYAALVAAPRHRVTLHTAATAEQAAPLVAEADVVYGWRFPPALYAHAPRLRWLQAAAAGVEWALVPELPPHVTLTRAPGIFGPWMAEYVLGWLLRPTQRMERYVAAQQQRRWIADVIPERLGGKTLAVIGLGDIGRTIARAAGALGMRVIGVSRTGRRVAGVARVWRVPGLRRALAEADAVVLTVPLTAETRGLIDASSLAAMKPSAWLVNIARGPIVDEAALVAALRAGRPGGAILDVFDQEPLPADHALWGLPNVVLTPHIAGPSTPEEIGPIFNENLKRFLAGRRLRHVVDRRRGY